MRDLENGRNTNGDLTINLKNRSVTNGWLSSVDPYCCWEAAISPVFHRCPTSHDY